MSNIKYSKTTLTHIPAEILRQVEAGVYGDDAVIRGARITSCVDDVEHYHRQVAIRKSEHTYTPYEFTLDDGIRNWWQMSTLKDCKIKIDRVLDSI
jgi:hypothetical protein